MLTVFVASSAPIACIVYRKDKTTYQLISWNMETDEFVEGQWIKHKKIYLPGCAISPNGLYFAWMYNECNASFKTCGGVSILPYFKAILYTENLIGRHFYFRFNTNNEIIDNRCCRDESLELSNNSFQFEIRPNTLNICIGITNSISNVAHSGMNVKSEFYEIIGNRIYRGANLIYDASNNSFAAITAPY